MKNLLSFLVVFVFTFLIISNATCEDNKNEDSEKLYIYEKVMSIELSKSDIILFSSAFIAERFTSAKSVVQLKDTELGKLVGNVILMNSNASFFDAFHGINGKLIIDSKDGKYRLQVVNINGVGKGGVTAAWSNIEGANRYRIEPMAKVVLDNFSSDLHAYLIKTKADSNW